MPERVKTIGRWILGISSLMLLSVLLYLDWSAANGYTQAGNLRLRWYASPREALTAGSLVTKEQLRPRLAWINSTLQLMPVDEMIGRYTLRPIAPGDAPQDGAGKPGFSRLAVHTPPPGGAIVSVEVATDHTLTLEAGSTIAFAKDKTVLPGPNDLCQRHAHPIVLLAVSPSTRDSKLTALTVAIPDCCLDLVPALSAGQWRPVLFSSVKAVAPANTGLKSSPSAKR